MVATGRRRRADAPRRALSAALAHYSIDFGEMVPVTGLLSGPDGLALPSAPVEVQTNADGRWVTSEHLTTAADGTFAGELHPRKRMYVRLRYPGPGRAARSDLGAAAAAAAAGDHAAPAGRAAARRGRARAGGGQRGAAQGVGAAGAAAAGARAVPDRGSARGARPRAGRFASSFVPAFRARVPLRGGGQVGRRHGPGLDGLADPARALSRARNCSNKGGSLGRGPYVPGIGPGAARYCACAAPHHPCRRSSEYSPCPVASIRTVRARMRRSSRSERCSTYQTSSSIRSGHGSDVRPLICAHPVMPGLHLEPAALALRVAVDLLLHGRARPDDRHLALAAR